MDFIFLNIQRFEIGGLSEVTWKKTRKAYNISNRVESFVSEVPGSCSLKRVGNLWLPSGAMAPLFLEGGSGAHWFGERNLGQLQGALLILIASRLSAFFCWEGKVMARCHGFIYFHMVSSCFLIFLRSLWNPKGWCLRHHETRLHFGTFFLEAVFIWKRVDEPVRATELQGNSLPTTLGAKTRSCLRRARP